MISLSENSRQCAIRIFRQFLPDFSLIILNMAGTKDDLVSCIFGGYYMKNYLSIFYNRHGKKKHKVQRQIKDRLFRFLFDKDREALLELYNALNGTDYKDASMLNVVTIESAVYC